jgi:hypothetical protein
MTGPQKQPRPSGNPTQWIVAALRWGVENSEQEVAMGKEIEAVEVYDRELAVAIAHHLLDKHAHEAIGRTSLEIHVTPPEQPSPDGEPSGFRDYAVSAEARKQAQTLGIRGDAEARVARMARRAAPFTHRTANRRFGRFLLRIEDQTVVWVGVLDTPDGSRKAK